MTTLMINSLLPNQPLDIMIRRSALARIYGLYFTFMGFTFDTSQVYSQEQQSSDKIHLTDVPKSMIALLF